MKVVIIDDEPDICLILAFELKSMGHETWNFTSTEEVLKFFAVETAVDAIVCDFQMPKMSGLDLFHELKKNGFKGEFYILTGEAAIDEQELLSAGIRDVFVKPDDLKRLISTFK